MSFPNSLLAPSTWRYLGLGLSTVVFCLGALAIGAPSTAGTALGATPTTKEGQAVNRKSMVFLGVRNIAVSVPLFWFYRERKLKEVGVLLASWTLVCLADIAVAIQGLQAGDSSVWTLWAGAAFCAFVGFGLAQS